MTTLEIVLSSAVGVALITSAKELIVWILNRRAKKADQKEEKNDDLKELKDTMKEVLDTLTTMKNDITTLQGQMSATVEHDKIILRDKIKYLISKYIEYGEITVEEKQAIKHMWNIYHFDLGGNGDLNDWMDMLEEIPVKDGAFVTHFSRKKEETTDAQHS